MQPGESTRILKRSPARSVRLELLHPGAPPRVVKRFHSQGLAAAARDRARAKRERELLGELHALGLPVPRPLELEPRDGGWEVTMEWIGGATPLAAILEGRSAMAGAACGAGARARHLARASAGLRRTNPTCTPAMRSSTSENADKLKKFDFLRITVEGHCDERGTVEYNLALGEGARRPPTTTSSHSACPPTG